MRASRVAAKQAKSLEELAEQAASTNERLDTIDETLGAIASALAEVLASKPPQDASAESAATAKTKQK